MEEVTKKKLELEKQIKDLIWNFSKDLNIDDINIDVDITKVYYRPSNKCNISDIQVKLTINI